VVGQRLARTVCESCAVDCESPLASRIPGLAPGMLTRAGTGCSACGASGTRGTTALFEIIAVGEAMRRALASGEDASRIEALALESGFRPMLMAGAERVHQGVLTPEELDRVVGLGPA
jgi:type II secretory ATPase GspE/PulE/Tfp pilus assembly ATPase PilB-like protein